jgi:hypothetical protein
MLKRHYDVGEHAGIFNVEGHAGCGRRFGYPVFNIRQ